MREAVFPAKIERRTYNLRPGPRQHAKMTESIEAAKQRVDWKRYWKEEAEALGFKGSEVIEYVKQMDESMEERERRPKMDPAEYADEQRQRREKEEEKEQAQERLWATQQHAAELNAEVLRGKLRNLELEQNRVDPKHVKIDFYHEGEGMDEYLTHFERIATYAGWPRKNWGCHLLGLLRGKAKQAVAHIPVDASTDYQKIKTLLLEYYKVDAETYRMRFRGAAREKDETMNQVLYKIEHALNQWIESSGKDPQKPEEIRDLLVMERMYECMSPSVAKQVRIQKPKTAKEVARTATEIEEAHRAALSGVNKGFKGAGAAAKGSLSSISSVGTETSETCESGETSGNTSNQWCARCKRNHSTRYCPQARRPIRGGVSGARRTWPNSRGGGRTGQTRPESRLDKDEKRAGAKAHRAVSSEEEEGEIKTLPSLCHHCAKKEYNPKCTLTVNGVQVCGIRDTGATYTVVARALVRDEDFTGETTTLITASGARYEVPIAEVDIVCPFFQGRVACVVLEEPNDAVLIGNLAASHWGDEPTAVPVYANPTTILQVKTRAQVQRDQLPIKDWTIKQVLDKISPAELCKMQQEDPSLESCRQRARVKARVQMKKGTATFYYRNGMLHRGFVARNGAASQQVIMPKGLRPQILALAHDQPMAGHLGVARTKHRVWQDFYWPFMSSDIKLYCQSCVTCQKTVDKGKVRPVPMVSVPVVGEPFDKVAVDIIGPVKPVSDAKNRYVLVMVDFVTRYPEAVPLRDIEASTVAEALITIWSRVGFPKEVLTDQGSQFTSGMMRDVYRMLGIQGITTTPYHAQANGLVERFNGTLKRMVKKLAMEKPSDWDRWIPAALFAYREVPQASTGFSPFELLYGRNVRGPMKVLRESWTGSDPDQVRTVGQFVMELKDNIQETCDIAKQSLIQASQSQKAHFDRKTVQRTFEPGERVLVLRPMKNNKLELTWKGPYKVVQKLNDVDYIVRVEQGVKTYHANLLKKFVERPAKLVPREARSAVAEVDRKRGEECARDAVGLHLASVLWHNKPSKSYTCEANPVLEVRVNGLECEYRLTRTNEQSTRVVRQGKRDKPQGAATPAEILFEAVVWALQGVEETLMETEIDVWVDEEVWNQVVEDGKSGLWTERMVTAAAQLYPYHWRFAMVRTTEHMTTVSPGTRLPSSLTEALRAVVVEEEEPMPVFSKEIPLCPLQPAETVDDVQICTTDPVFRDQLQQLVYQYPDVFTDIPNRTNLEECTIELDTDDPIRVKPYPVPFALREAVEKEVQDMLKLDVIEPSVSSYASPIVLVKKKDGSMRFCVDYRRLNKHVKFDVEPIPDMEYLFSKLGDAQVLTKIDLSKGYWQVPIKVEDRPKTAFQTPQGVFQWKVVPFGMTTSGAVFSRMMRKLILPLQCPSIDNFIDDVLVATATRDEHLRVLKKLFDRMRECKLSARPSKCEIAAQEVEYLGHIVGKGEIRPTVTKMEKIRDAAQPVTRKEVKSFLGLVSYYRRFVPNFSDTATPLIEAAGSGGARKVEWTEECDRAFTRLKQAFCAAPVRRLPQAQGLFVLRTDASDLALGAILLQQQQGEIHPVACASRKLLGAEKKYPIVEKEFLAIYWAINKFSSFLYGTEFLIQTDHAPLRAWESLKSASGRITKWALLLQPYKFKIEVIPGKENHAADFLSRNAAL